MKERMSVKDNILEIFENSRGEHLSGEYLASKLGVSRTAIWKAVKSLNEQGYIIEGVNNKGYCMIDDNDLLSSQSIKKYLNTEMRNIADIEVFKTIDSTNTYLKKLANQGEKQWKIIISEEQTLGRGRMNRSFYSPPRSGIYMSILFRPELFAKEALFITTMAAVAVSEAIEEVCGIGTSIKWVNDIFCGDRKVAGILTEAALDVESGKLEYAILGIGINVFPPENDFPEEIKDIVTTITNNNTCIKDIRSKIIGNVLNNIYNMYGSLKEHSFMDRYISRSMLIGKKVYITSDSTKEELFVDGISDEAGLIVINKIGEKRILSSGEVSVRKINS